MQRLSHRTRLFALLQFLRSIWGLFLLGAELWMDKWEVLQSPRAMAVGIPAWLCAHISRSFLPLPSCLPLGLQERCGDHSRHGHCLCICYMLWHQQELG